MDKIFKCQLSEKDSKSLKAHAENLGYTGRAWRRKFLEHLANSERIAFFDKNQLELMKLMKGLKI